MKLPWVSRAYHEAVVSGWDRQAQDLHVLWGQYNDLLDKYHTLKLSGAVAMPDPNEYIEPPLTVDEQDALRAQEDEDA
jgi:hypothetical protein